jgi:hypothetical protein
VATELEQVIDSDAEELAALQAVQRLADAESDTPEPEPTAAAEPPIDRAQPTGERQPPPKPAKVDLTQLPEFRTYQAEADRRYEEERKRRLELERMYEEAQQRQNQAHIEQLTQAASEAVDPQEQRQYIEQITALRSQEHMRQMRQWEEYKTAQIKERGLEPTDPRFQRQYSSGQVGLYEFQKDLAEAEAAKLRAENSKAKTAADPANIAQLVKQEVARLARAQGLDTVDVGTPQGDVDDAAAFERDVQLAQAGRISADAFTKRWGSP